MTTAMIIATLIIIATLTIIATVRALNTITFSSKKEKVMAGPAVAFLLLWRRKAIVAGIVVGSVIAVTAVSAMTENTRPTEGPYLAFGVNRAIGQGTVDAVVPSIIAEGRDLVKAREVKKASCAFTPALASWARAKGAVLGSTEPTRGEVPKSHTPKWACEDKAGLRWRPASVNDICRIVD